jgi:DNA-directed RNA polymerase sigma subunit (sigma70/sigma32)
MKLSQLATKFGVSRERARQLEQRLKAQIRAYLQEELGDDLQPAIKKRRPSETIALAMANSAVQGFEQPIVLQGA